MAKNELLRQALAEQEQRLAELNARLTELAPLQQERNNVHTLVSQMRFSPGLGPYGVSGKTERSETPEQEGANGLRPLQPIWMVAKAVIEQAGHPPTPGEIAGMLYGLGFKTLLGRPGRETVRSLLNKKKNIFQKLDDGKFAVRKA